MTWLKCKALFLAVKNQPWHYQGGGKGNSFTELQTAPGQNRERFFCSHEQPFSLFSPSKIVMNAMDTKAEKQRPLYILPKSKAGRSL